MSVSLLRDFFSSVARLIVKSSKEKKTAFASLPFFREASGPKGQGVTKFNENEHSNAVCAGVSGTGGSVRVQEAALVPLRPTSILTFYCVSWEAKGTLITFSPQASLTLFGRRHHVTRGNLLQPTARRRRRCVDGIPVYLLKGAGSPLRGLDDMVVCCHRSVFSATLLPISLFRFSSLDFFDSVDLYTSNV